MTSQDGAVTVLLVEDTEDNRFMMRRLLEMSGYHVVEATNGEEAVRLAETESPEIAQRSQNTNHRGLRARHF
jgi:response regulator RpfG family c-di-GMP phosphodiesterase